MFAAPLAWKARHAQAHTLAEKMHERFDIVQGVRNFLLNFTYRHFVVAFAEWYVVTFSPGRYGVS